MAVTPNFDDSTASSAPQDSSEYSIVNLSISELTERFSTLKAEADDSPYKPTAYVCIPEIIEIRARLDALEAQLTNLSKYLIPIDNSAQLGAADSDGNINITPPDYNHD